MLHLSVFHGHLEVLKLLLDWNIDKFSCNNDGYSALHIAAFKNRNTMIPYLLNKKLDINAKTNLMQTPLHLAALCGHLDAVKSNYWVQEKMFMTNKYIYIICMAKQLGVVALLEANVKNTKNIDGFTPLHAAVFECHNHVVLELIRSKVNVEIQDEVGCTPFQMAIQAGYVEIVKIFLEEIPEVVTRPSNLETALRTAMTFGYTNIAMHLRPWSTMSLVNATVFNPLSYKYEKKRNMNVLKHLEK